MIEKYAIPLSILIAGVFIGSGILLSGGIQIDTDTPGASQSGTQAQKTSFRAVSADEHVLGSIDAPVKIIEYSDLECPFCKSFHPTLEQIVQEYDGQVAWVYRHFPLQNHPQARPAAIASECVAQLNGNEAFWSYIGALFAGAPASLNDPASAAAQQGVDRAAFSECIADETIANAVDTDYSDAVASGGTGTPHSLIVGPDGTVYPLVGNQPIGAVRAVIDTILD